MHSPFMAIITDPSHNQFASLWKAAAAYAYGRPPPTVKLESDAPEDTGEVVVARLVAALPNLLAMVPDARAKMVEALDNAEVVPAEQIARVQSIYECERMLKAPARKEVTTEPTGEEGLPARTS